MSILNSVIQFKQLEREKELADINQIGQTAANFVSLQQQAQQRARENQLQDLQMQNIRSQIAEREKPDQPNILEQIKIGQGLLESGKLARRADLMNQGQAVLDKLVGSGKGGQTKGAISDVNEVLAPEAQLPQFFANKADIIGRTDPDGIVRQEISNDQKLMALINASQQTNAFGEQTSQGKLAEIKVEEEQTKRKIPIKVEEQQATQLGKAQEKTGRDTMRAGLVSSTAMDATIKFDKENFDKFGVKPGDYFGLFAKLQPKQTNEYKAAALGAGREAAATVGMSIIPQARAVRMVKLFEGSTAEIGNTIEGNANNVSFSLGNTFARRISDNIPMEMEDGKSVPLQNLVRDPKTGKLISEFPAWPMEEKEFAIDRARADFVERVNNEYTQRAFDVDPNLLQEDTLAEMIDSMSEEELIELQKKLGE